MIGDALLSPNSKKASHPQTWMLLALATVLLAACGASPINALPPAVPQTGREFQSQNPPVVTIQALSGKTIPFQTQNGKTIKDLPSQASQLPELVLTRNGALSAREERTLIVNVDGIPLFPNGTLVTITAETQHPDPDQSRSAREGIMVWSDTMKIEGQPG